MPRRSKRPREVGSRSVLIEPRRPLLPSIRTTSFVESSFVRGSPVGCWWQPAIQEAAGENGFADDVARISADPAEAGYAP